MAIFEVPVMVSRTSITSMIKLTSADSAEQYLNEMLFCEALDCDPSGLYCRDGLYAECGVSATDWAKLREMFPKKGIKAKVKVDYTDTSSDIDPIKSVTINDSFVICFGSCEDRMRICKSRRIPRRIELEREGSETVTQSGPSVVIHIHAGGGGGCCCCGDDE